MSRILINGKIVLAEKAILAESTADRTRGLLGRTSLPLDTAMLIRPCRSIHTWFMRFPIDVYFLDQQMSVMKIAKNVKPWRMVFGPQKAVMVLETATGMTSDIKPGDFLTLE